MAIRDFGDDVVIPVPRPAVPQSHPYLTGFDPEATLSRPPEPPRPPLRIPIVLALSALGALVCSIVAVDHSERLGSFLRVGKANPRRIDAPRIAILPMKASPITAADLADLPESVPTQFDLPPSGFSLTLALNSVVEENRTFTALPAFPLVKENSGFAQTLLAAPSSPPRTIAHTRRTHRARRTARLNFFQRLYTSGYRYAQNNRGINLAFLGSASIYRAQRKTVTLHPGSRTSLARTR